MITQFYKWSYFQHIIDSLLQLSTALATDLMFLNNQVLGVEVGWNVRNTDDCGAIVESVKRCQTDKSYYF